MEASRVLTHCMSLYLFAFIPSVQVLPNGLRCKNKVSLWVDFPSQNLKTRSYKIFPIHKKLGIRYFSWLGFVAKNFVDAEIILSFAFFDKCADNIII